MCEVVLFDGPVRKQTRGMAQPISPEPPARIAVTPRTTLKRHPERGTHDRAAIHAILDEALVCHVSAVIDGAPRVLPTAHARIGDRIYLHGARANRLLATLAAGAPACICVTLLDGIVLARSWFHHSMNYRCVVLHGVGDEVTDADEKLAALAALVDKVAPGRTREARGPTSQELAGSLVVRFPVSEASAKVRSGPPIDGPELLPDDCWAGVLPLRTAVLPAVDDGQLRPGVARSAAAGERARTFTSAAFPPYERTEGDLLVSTDPGRIDFELVHRFLSEESYWARGVEAWRQRQAMSHSLSFGLYRRGQQIGFARVVTDHGRVAYLADVFVVRQARGQGFARFLIAALLEHPDVAGVDRWLLGTADAHGLYERFGFERVEGRYMIRRRPA
jgi:nitroimidazol reductase NimA-like FMN-containing flavoprotein (pyridoxamine 5'-phosphate oxidase superfamily)/GNAT superfamily N-acetyltransferase